MCLVGRKGKKRKKKKEGGVSDLFLIKEERKGGKATSTAVAAASEERGEKKERAFAGNLPSGKREKKKLRGTVGIPYSWASLAAGGGKKKGSMIGDF